MSRELRRVPPDWEHPRGDDLRYRPLYDETFEEAAADWKRRFIKWENGGEGKRVREKHGPMEFWEWEGEPPDRDLYRPAWPEESRTHFQMYETTSEGTPISPVMPDIESLARWLADNNASAFAGETATYEEWLAMCKAGHSVASAVFSRQTGIISGVAAVSRPDL